MKQSAPPVSRSLPASTCIVAAGIAAHALLPLTDYILWDGWWYVADLARPEGPTIMRRLFGEVGRPLDLLFYQPLRVGGWSPTLAVKWLAPAAWTASGVCMAFVLRRIAAIPRSVATAIAVLAVTSPVFDLLGEISLWMNVACVLLFWLAWSLVAVGIEYGTWRAGAVRLLALVMFFLSFNLNSHLVFLYAVAATLFGLRTAGESWRTIRASATRSMIRHADFLSLPIVFWLWKNWFTPTSGYYATGYNQPSLNPARLANGFGTVATQFLGPWLWGLLSSPSGIGAASIVFLGAFVWSQRKFPGEGVCQRRGLKLMMWGFLLLLAAAFPYLAVGQPLASDGWASRNAILCHLPIAMMAVGLLLLVNAWLLPTRQHAWAAAACGLVALFAINCQRNYLAFQAFGAKQRAVQRLLQRDIEERNACFVQLRDYYVLPRTIPYYAPAIWTFIGADAGAEPRAFVMDTRAIAQDQVVTDGFGQSTVIMPQLQPSAQDIDAAIEATTMPYAMTGIPREGKQFLLAITPGSLGNDGERLGWQDLWLRFFDPRKRTEFQDRMIEGRILDLPAVEKR